MDTRLDRCTIAFCDNGCQIRILLDFIKCIRNEVDKIYIINFCKRSLIEEVPDELQSQVIWKNASKLIDTEIEETLISLTNKDILCVLGVERLVQNTSDNSAIKLSFDNKSTKLHHEYDENWEPLSRKIDSWLATASRKKMALWVFIAVTVLTEQKIAGYLDKSKYMSMIAVRFEDSLEKLKQSIIDIIVNQSISTQDKLERIEEHRSALGVEYSRYLKAITYKIAGDISTTIDMLEKAGVKNLDIQEKLLLAECYYLNDRSMNALDMLEKIYNEDPYIRGLAPAILRSVRGTEFEDEWVNKLYHNDPDNEAVMEAYGSFCSRNGNNKEAAQIFRNLSELKSGYYQYYYEVVACINDIIYKNLKTEDAIWDYFKDVLKQKPILINEVVIRCVHFFKVHLKDFSAAFRFISHADIQIDALKAKEIVSLKKEMLKDLSLTADLSPDWESKKCRTLLEIMFIDCYDDTAYYRWRQFMNDSMCIDDWNKNLYLELLNMIPEFAAVNYLEEDEMSTNKYRDALRLMVRYGGTNGKEYMSDDEIENEIIIGAKRAFKVSVNPNDEIWADFYGSLLLSYRSRYQAANNHALTLFLFAELNTDLDFKKKCGYLGLIAWGNNQFRLGREAEGIACIMASFYLAKNINEFTTFLEFAVPLLAQYLIRNSDFTRSSELELVNQFIAIFSPLNSNVKDMHDIISSEFTIKEGIDFIIDTNQRIEDKLKNATKIVDAITWMNQTNNIEAYDIVYNYGDVILEVFKIRKDIIDSIYLIFAQTLYNKKNKDLKKVYKYIKHAIFGIEEKRLLVFHQEERVSISRRATRIYYFYLKFLSELFLDGKVTLPDGKSIKEEIFCSMQKVLPRTLEEQNIYINERNITEKEEEEFQHYIELSKQYRFMKQNHNDEDPIIMDIEQKMTVFYEVLKLEHPYFAPLSELSIFSLDEIKSNLNNSEAVVQILLIDDFMIIFILTANDSKYIYANSEGLKKSIEEFTLFWTIGEDQAQCQDISDKITKQYFESIYDYIETEQITRLYLISDFKLGYFTLTGSRCNEKHLVDLVDSLINITSYETLRRKREHTLPKKIYNQVQGSDSDSVIYNIRNWLETVCTANKNMLMVDNDIKLQINEATALIIYGHGVNNNSSAISKGALGIWQGDHIIYVEDILKMIKPQNPNYFFLMSCSGGIPVGHDPEATSGSWVQMFERLRGGIICCHWDVTDKAVCDFLSAILNHLKDDADMNIIFIKALREVRLKYNNLDEWAGFEYWEN